MHTPFKRWRRFISGILITTMIFCFQEAEGQELNWKIRHISVEDGLLNRFINCIVQDERGFVWIGTNFGLNRYDGYRIEVMTREENGLFSNTIVGLHLDHNNKIWVVHRESRISAITHVDIIDPITFAVTPLEKYLPRNEIKRKITEVISGNKNEIYLLTEDSKLYRYDKNGIKSLLPEDYNQGISNLRYVDDDILFQTSKGDSIKHWTKEGKPKGGYAVPPNCKGLPGEIAISYLGLTKDEGRVFEATTIDSPYFCVYVLHP